MRLPVVINSNLPPILRRFQVMADYGKIFAIDRGVPHFNAPAGGKSNRDVRISIRGSEIAFYLRSIDSSASFKSQLKTTLFLSAYGST